MNSYFDRITTVAHVGATVSAAVIACGASIGFHDMTGSWPLAILGGIGIASLLGLGWFTLITMGHRVRKTSGRVITILFGILLVSVALGTSGWALATAIGGKQALANYQITALTEHELALADAASRVNEQSDLTDSVRQHAAATTLLGDEEGRSGQGPLFRSYQRTADNLTNAAAAMDEQIAAGDAVFARGIAALDRANRNLGNAEAFRLAMSEVEAVIVEMNAIDISSDVLSMGMVGLNDKGLPELKPLTASLRETANGATADQVAVPRYTPMTRSEATIVMKPTGAWIVAVAIDSAPLLLLLMVMLAVSEPLMRNPVPTKRRVTEDEIRTNEEDIVGLRVVAE